MTTILVVDDEYLIADILGYALEDEGFMVVKAGHGQKGLEVLERERPDLITTDFMMPVMNGGELGQALSQDRALSQIPFIFMSGTSQDIVRRAFSGYDAFLVKPIEFDSLLLVVKRLLAQGQAPRAANGQVEESMRHLLKGIHMPSRD